MPVSAAVVAPAASPSAQWCSGGAALGLALGPALGPAVGPAVGLALGPKVGLVDGLLVGPKVGRWSHLLWLVLLWCHPVGHCWHAAALVCALYVPAAHAVHDDAPGALYVPAAQAVHDVASEQPAPLCRPAGQSAQVLHCIAVPT